MIALGDMVERFLRFFGVTKKRVQAIAGKKDCGCARRQQALNEWGHRWQVSLRVRYGPTVTRIRICKRYLGMAFRALFYGG